MSAERPAAYPHDYDGRHDADARGVEQGDDPAVEAAASPGDVPAPSGGQAARQDVSDPVAHAASAATVQCRALTEAGPRCKKQAEPGSSPELCHVHRRMRVSHGYWPMVPGWAVKERQGV